MPQEDRIYSTGREAIESLREDYRDFNDDPDESFEEFAGDVLDIFNAAPDAVFSGFHLTNPGLGVDEPEALIRAVGEELRRRPTHYYTGHCTGQGPYAILKEMLGDQITYMAGGTEFTL